MPPSAVTVGICAPRLQCLHQSTASATPPPPGGVGLLEFERSPADRPKATLPPGATGRSRRNRVPANIVKVPGLLSMGQATLPSDLPTGEQPARPTLALSITRHRVRCALHLMRSRRRSRGRFCADIRNANPAFYDVEFCMCTLTIRFVDVTEPGSWRLRDQRC